MTTDRPPCECGRADRFPSDRSSTRSSRGEFRSRCSDDLADDLPSAETPETVDTAEAADEVPVGVAIESDNDRIFGGTGNDWIFGQSGDDVLFGGELDSVLTTEFLSDLLLSGSGAA
jgi:hypothetical protein